MTRTTIYFDLETDGVREDCQIIQLAAIAVDDAGNELATFQRKLSFDESAAEAEALKINHYSREQWELEALAPSEVVRKFKAFLDPYKQIELVSKRSGQPYNVARLAGYNAQTFDAPRLQKLFFRVGVFLPAHPHVLDVLQRAVWFYQENPDVARPANMRLATVAEALGIGVDGAHDALVDVRLTIQVAREIARRSRMEVEA